MGIREKNLYSCGTAAVLRRDEAGSTRPGSHSSRHKKAGVAALENSIAAGAGFGNMAGRANAALERAGCRKKRRFRGVCGGGHVNEALVGVVGRVEAGPETSNRGCKQFYKK